MSSFTRLPLQGSTPVGDGGPRKAFEEAEEFVPREVRAARRNAAAVLALSLAVFGVSVALVLQTAPPPTAQGPPESIVGFNSLDPDLAMQGSSMASSFEDDGQGIIHPPYHLVVDCELRQQGFEGGKPIRTMRQGAQIFPLKYHGAWVQVVVPKGTDGLDATFGWLPMQVDGAPLLKRDAFPRGREPGTPRQADPPQEELKKRWDEVRAKNMELKGHLASLQSSVKDTYVQQIRSARESAKSSAAKGAKEVFNVQELQKIVREARDGVHKEFKRSPDAIMKDLQHAIEE